MKVVVHDKTLACVLHHLGMFFADNGCHCCTCAQSTGLQAEHGMKEREREMEREEAVPHLVAVQLLLGTMRK